MITGHVFGDPGPCPVCDTPHTACVGPSPQGNNTPTQPPRNQPGAPTAPRIISRTTGPAWRSFTTATYRGWCKP